MLANPNATISQNIPETILKKLVAFTLPPNPRKENRWLRTLIPKYDWPVYFDNIFLSSQIAKLLNYPNPKPSMFKTSKRLLNYNYKCLIFVNF